MLPIVEVVKNRTFKELFEK